MECCKNATHNPLCQGVKLRLPSFNKSMSIATVRTFISTNIFGSSEHEEVEQAPDQFSQPDMGQQPAAPG